MRDASNAIRLPCPVFVGGIKLCGRQDDRPIVMDALLGTICRDHRPALIPQPKAEARDG